MARIDLRFSCLTLPEKIAKARQDARTRTTDQNNKEDVVDRLLTQLASYVGSVTDDDERMTQSSGMDKRTKSFAASEALSAPLSLVTTARDHDGEVYPSRDAAVVAKSYLEEQSPDPPTATSWTHARVSTKSKMTISGLTSGTCYRVRVAVVGPSGLSGWNDPAEDRAMNSGARAH